MNGLSEKIEITTGVQSSTSGHTRIMIIYTGGTFGMLPDKEGVLVPFDFLHALEYLPMLKKIPLEISVISFVEPLDSSTIGCADWQLIGKAIFDHYDEHDGFLVLHGTDTMAYTSSAISFMLQNIAKPVVFTGAQLPISKPRSDARAHLLTALEIASAYEKGKPVVPEVCLYFNYELHRGCRAQKTQSAYFDAFQSGSYPLLAKAGVRIDYARNLIRPIGKKKLTLLTHFDTRIATLRLFPGMSPAYVKAVTEISGLQGLILETYGSGNALDAKWFIRLLQRAVEKNILLLNISQCPAGCVMQGRYKTSRLLKDIGVISGFDMTVEAATTKLMLLLGEYGVEEAKKKIGISLAGELEPIAVTSQ